MSAPLTVYQGRDNLFINLSTCNTSAEKKNIPISAELRYDRTFLLPSTQSDFCLSVNTASIPLGAIPLVYDLRNTNYVITVLAVDTDTAYVRNIYNNSAPFATTPMPTFEYPGSGDYGLYNPEMFVHNLDKCLQQGLQDVGLTAIGGGALNSSWCRFRLDGDRIVFDFDANFYTNRAKVNIFFNRELADVIGLPGAHLSNPMTSAPADNYRDFQLLYLSPSAPYVPVNGGLNYLSEVNALVVQCSLPTRAEIIQGSFKSTDVDKQTGAEKILTTFNMVNQLNHNGSIVYNSTSEYRRATLQDAGNIDSVSVNMFVQLKNGQLKQAYMKYGEIFTMKLLFERIVG